jgi:endonuclease-3
MPASNRATLIGRLSSALKKHYKPVPTGPSRPLLEHVLYASLLEDALAELADEGMAKCEQEFFDWNEVRVTTVTELSQVLSRLPDPMKAAQRLKSNLQGIFEEFYTFDLDHLKKENLGKAVNKFEKMPGMTPFVLSYTIQHGLGGHSIPIDYSAMVIMLATDIATQPEAMSGKVPGLERAIPKSKGIEFSGLLHQAAVALNKSTKDKKARAMLDAVGKGSSKRLDEWLADKKAAKKRAVKRKVAEKEAAKEAKKAAAEAAKAAATKKKKSTKSAPAKSVAVAPKATAKKDVAKKVATKKVAPKKSSVAAKKATTKKASKKAPAKKAPAKKAVTKKAAAKRAAAKKSATKKRAAKKPTTKKKPAKKATGKKSTKKSANRKLTKRKPR